jgi:uncharacterized protein (TIGR03435 family)
MRVLCLAAVLFAQSQNPEPHLEFEVASVKANTSSSTNSSINNHAGGVLDCVNVTFRQLISFAYDVRDYQILNAPGWAATEHYDILAKPSAADAAAEPTGKVPSPAAGERLRRRTQALLADRFGLVLRTESREMSVYALVVANGGPKLTESKTEVGPQMSWNDRKLTCKKVTIQRFAEAMIASRLNRYVVDKTGLSGEYDFQMEFVPDPPPSKPGDPAASSDPAGPSFETALQEQLGLKLVTTKAPVPFLAIEKADRPSAN